MASGKVEIEETLIGPKIGEGKKGRLKMHMKNAEGHSIIQCTRGYLSSSSARFPCLAIGKETLLQNKQSCTHNKERSIAVFPDDFNRYCLCKSRVINIVSIKCQLIT